MVMRRPYSIQVFLYRRISALEFLLFNRVARPDLDLPAFWQGISGALEKGESFEDAAIREVPEETALHLHTVTASGFTYNYPIRPEWRVHYGPAPAHVEERVFFAPVAADANPTLSQEHDEWAWCPISEARQKLSFGRNCDAFDSVVAALAMHRAIETASA